MKCCNTTTNSVLSVLGIQIPKGEIFCKTSSLPSTETTKTFYCGGTTDPALDQGLVTHLDYNCTSLIPSAACGYNNRRVSYSPSLRCFKCFECGCVWENSSAI